VVKKRLAWEAVVVQDAAESGELLQAKLRVRARLIESARLRRERGVPPASKEAKEYGHP
jgi:hypothetical protein